MDEEFSVNMKLIDRTISMFSNPFALLRRNKPITLQFVKIDNYWVPMLVCAFCGKGPISNFSDDTCCGVETYPASFHPPEIR